MSRVSRIADKTSSNISWATFRAVFVSTWYTYTILISFFIWALIGTFSIYNEEVSDTFGASFSVETFNARWYARNTSSIFNEMSIWANFKAISVM
jgi:hypothetical protein